MVAWLRNWGHACERLQVVARRAARTDAGMVHRGAGAERGCALMAGRTIERGRDVGRGLAHYPASAGVARGAARRDARVVEGCACKAHKTLVASHAVCGCCYVGRGLRDRRHAGEAAAVMAGGAPGGDPGVVHGRAWPEGSRVLVAGRAVERRRDVGRRLANHAARAGVARGAARCDARVIKGCAREADETLVAGHAIRGCRDVGRGLRDRRYAGEAATVMAGGAAGGDPGVVHGRAWPEGCRALVAGRAIKRGRNVGRRLTNHAARAGVARGAARRDARVIEGCACKADETLVAGHAVCGRCDMGRWLRDWRDAGEAAAVVAGGAARGDAGVVHRRVGAIRRALVARRAGLRGRDMVRGHAARRACEGRETLMAGRAIGAGRDVRRGLRDGRDAGKAAAVVAGGAARGDAGMVHGRAGTERRRGFVAGRAIERGREMRGWLRDRRDAREGLAAVAGGAPGGDPGVVHLAAREAREPGLVAGRAVRRCREMAGGLRDGRHTREAAAVVASGAARGDAGVVHRRVGAIRRALVARRAGLRGRNVVRGHAA